VLLVPHTSSPFTCTKTRKYPQKTPTIITNSFITPLKILTKVHKNQRLKISRAPKKIVPEKIGPRKKLEKTVKFPQETPIIRTTSFKLLTKVHKNQRPKNS
jgi:hypothetical protein